MGLHRFLLVILVFATAFVPRSQSKKWLTDRHRKYNLLFTAEDRKNKKAYTKFFDNGVSSVTAFFSHPFYNKFNVYIHPDRRSLDSTWRQDWKLSSFTSECWMVASGVGAKLDVLSPSRWDQQACEHVYADQVKTQKLIAHELVHVYHGQINASHDFSDVRGIDWFVEGIATYASGQCDSAWLERIDEAIMQNEIPGTLDSFWTGKLRYGLSGSVVMYLDIQYGRDKIKELLTVTNRSELFAMLGTDEARLIAGWKQFMAR